MKSVTDARGLWILIDMLSTEQFGLLSVGDVNYSGASVRKNLDPLGRELLIGRFRQVCDGSGSLDETVSLRGESWHVHVEPILSPINHSVIAALGVYVGAGEVLPERPVVGALEWEISEGGKRIETVWNDDMFTLYEISRPGARSATGDMNQWVSQFIAPEDRARMKFLIDRGIAHPDDQRHLVSYRIITGGDRPGSKHLEASGRVYTNEAGEVKWLRSITREVSHLSPAVSPVTADMISGALLRAAFDLAGERVLAAVDMSCWQFFMTSPNWSSFRLQLPAYGYLPHTIHPDDVSGFRRLCEDGRAAGAGAGIRFLHTDGSYRRYRVAASSGLETQNPRYVIISLHPDAAGSAAS